MALLSVCETTTFRWSFEEDVDRYRRLGIAGIGVWRQKLSDFGEEKGAELLAEYGLKVSSLHWAGGFTGSDGRSYKAAIEDAMDAVRLAGELKAECLLVYSGARGGHTYNHARRLFRDALKTLAPMAEQHGVNLAIEPMHPACAEDFTFITNWDEYLQVFSAVDSPRLKLLLDTYHLGFEEGLIERIPELVPRIGLVQLGDGRGAPSTEQNRCLLGKGVVPLREIVARLRTHGYDGFFEIELIGEDLESMDYEQILRESLQFCQTIDLP
ncbi:MAG: sugar phosphate isomerase/epimerase [Thermogutta sp.]|nr:sugar phosphate isomerase/epimerase [Thermogutta sp.]